MYGLVLVTGAAGFVGAHVTQTLLARGYRVRGTVRDPKSAKNAFLHRLEGAAERLEVVRMDVLDEESVRTAMQNVDAVLHVASPYVVSVSPSEVQQRLFDPAVRGTRTVLTAADACGVKRVVVTSSIAAVVGRPYHNAVYDERDWNLNSSAACNPYLASKTLAEQEAWKLARTASFSLATVLPALVFGPQLGNHDVDPSARKPKLNESMRVLASVLSGQQLAVVDLAMHFVDVRDVAEMHVRVLENTAFQGRVLCAGSALQGRQFFDALRRAAPQSRHRLPRFDLTRVTPVVKLAAWTRPRGDRQYLNAHVGVHYTFDTSRATNEFGMQFRDAETVLSDAARWLQDHGYLPDSTCTRSAL
ncbi:MAG: hypothetical protein MHM6MM_000298 [Cercozoa sp. M6MM]